MHRLTMCRPVLFCACIQELRPGFLNIFPELTNFWDSISVIINNIPQHQYFLFLSKMLIYGFQIPS